jgi:hypothetical protein
MFDILKKDSAQKIEACHKIKDVKLLFEASHRYGHKKM